MERTRALRARVVRRAGRWPTDRTGSSSSPGSPTPRSWGDLCTCAPCCVQPSFRRRRAFRNRSTDPPPHQAGTSDDPPVNGEHDDEYQDQHEQQNDHVIGRVIVPGPTLLVMLVVGKTARRPDVGVVGSSPPAKATKTGEDELPTLELRRSTSLHCTCCHGLAHDEVHITRQPIRRRHHRSIPEAPPTVAVHVALDRDLDVHETVDFDRQSLARHARTLPGGRGSDVEAAGLWSGTVSVHPCGTWFERFVPGRRTGAQSGPVHLGIAVVAIGCEPCENGSTHRESVGWAQLPNVATFSFMTQLRIRRHSGPHPQRGWRRS